MFNLLLFGFGSEDDAFFLGGGMMVGVSEEYVLLIEKNSKKITIKNKI